MTEYAPSVPIGEYWRTLRPAPDGTPAVDAAPPPASTPSPPKRRARRRRGEIPLPPDGAPDPADKLPPEAEYDPAVAKRPPLGTPKPSPTDPGPAPIRAIGTRGMRFYFFDRMGQIVDMGAQALGQSSQVIALFGGGDGMAWLRNRFPHYDKDGEWTKGFAVRECNDWLVHECRTRGLFDPDRLPMRGHGVWTAQGMVAVHVGDLVIFIRKDGKMEERPAGFMDRGALWSASASVPPPAPAVAAEIAQQVERMFTKWHWWNLGEERVFTGLWAAGLLGAAINWRPHGLLIGPAGSGKSTLLELYCALSPLAMAVNDYTAAGIIQFLTGRAAPLILDEADEDPETMGRLQRVISLLRRASGGDGARQVRGTGEGTARTATFTSPAILGAVLSPSLMPQDASRITKMELIRIPDGTPALPIDEMMGWAKKHAGGLWGRAIEGIPRFRINLACMRAALLGRGCSPRLADQLGVIMAARAMIMEDEPLDDIAADADALSIAWLLQTRAQAIEDGGSMRCLQHLLTSQADLLESGQRPTFERLITRALDQHNADSGDARRKLIDHGIKLTRYPARATGPECLLVARSHPALAKVFAGTLWGGGRWGDDLKHLPGACVPTDPVSFRHGVKPRCVAIPLDCLPGDDATPAPAVAAVSPEDIPL